MKQRFSKRTRLVSALLTLAMVFTFLPFSAFAATDSDDSGYVENTNTFPDEAFWSYLLKYVDKNRNGTLSQEERYAVETINVNYMNIRSLKGIEFFPNLTELYCVGNQLTELDMSQNKELQTLDCVVNQLTELDVSQNKKLKKLQCSANQLTELDVRSNTALERLSCKENQLTELDVSNNTALMKLYCGKNQLTELDLSQNSKLIDLDCGNNQLTSLNVDSCAEFIDFGCKGNEYPVKVSAQTRTFDLHTLPGGFDPSRASDWEGGTVSNGILTVDSGATEVTYSYDCGRGKTRRFALQVLTITRIKQVNLRVNTPKKNEMPDETVVILDNGADVCDAKIYWVEGDGVGGKPITGSFRPGKRYTLQVGLYAKPGYKFSKDTVCTVNGRETEFIWTQNDDTEYCAIKHYSVSLSPGGFEHDHKMEMTHDEYSHWMECPICHTVQDTEAHVYDNDKDTTCNVCGYVRSLTPGGTPGGSTPGGDTPGGTTPGGSTGGGFKVQRCVILWKSGSAAMRKMVHPNSVNQVKSDNKILRPEALHHVWSYLILYLGVLLASFLLLSLDDMDFGTAISAVITCTNNIGPGINSVGPMENFSFLSDFSKAVLSADMLLGRLEIFPMLMLLLPSMWSRK